MLGSHALVYLNAIGLLLMSTSVWALTIKTPEEGLKVHAGASITVVAEPAAGEVIESVQLTSWKQFYVDKESPYEFIVNVPLEALGPLRIGVLAVDKQTGDPVSDRVSVFVTLPPEVVLQRIEADPNPVFLFKLPSGSDPNDMEAFERKYLSVGGLYSDGIERSITSASASTTYSSSDEQVVTVDADGLVRAQGVGTARITVKNGAHEDIVQVIVEFEPNP